MTTLKTSTCILMLAITGLAACDLVDPNRINDPNNPSVNEVLENATPGQLQNLASGLESRHRGSTVGALDFTGSLGREFYPMYASDPRFMDQWLGLDKNINAETEESFYQAGQIWSVPYGAIKQANLLLQAVQNTGALTEQEANGYLGFAKTIKAFQYLIPLLTHGKDANTGGIRFDVADPLNPGPFISFGEGLTRIRALLDEAQTDLENAGSSFAFNLTNGLASFNTPATFIILNRAIDARTAIYAEDWGGAIQSLEAAEPFFELAQGEDVMNKGAYFVYSGPPDQFNPYYYPPNAATNQILMVHPSMIDDAEAGDERVVQKFFERDDAVIQVGLSSAYQDARFESNTSPVPWIRNEELILIYAEAKAQRNEGTDLANAVDAINLVRQTWNLAPFASTDREDVIDQILFERRYSLWGEFGHRWLDAIRYEQLDELPTDGGQIFRYVARPLSENTWEDFAGNNN